MASTTTLPCAIREAHDKVCRVPGPTVGKSFSGKKRENTKKKKKEKMFVVSHMQGTRQTYPLCREPHAQHTANMATLPCVPCIAHDKVCMFAVCYGTCTRGFAVCTCHSTRQSVHSVPLFFVFPFQPVKQNISQYISHTTPYDTIAHIYITIYHHNTHIDHKFHQHKFIINTSPSTKANVHDH
jgi:hypothetical protein